MNTFMTESAEPRAVGVKFARDTIVVDLNDGRTLMVPIGWYPRLSHGTTPERNHWRLVGGGEGIHWPDLDEDIEVAGLLAGKASGESQTSLQRWLQARNNALTDKHPQPTGRRAKAQG